MKKKSTYSRGPYKQKDIRKETIEIMIKELKDFKERFKITFETSHYRTRVMKTLQQEVDCLEKVYRRQRHRSLEIEQEWLSYLKEPAFNPAPEMVSEL